MFVHECWYVAAWSSEVSSTPIARTLLNEDVVLYRQADGQVGALEDRCCHRNLPLSMGEVCGDTLVCSYHGLAYNKAGLCVNIPCQDKIPPNAKVRSYPVTELDGAVWIWMSDAERADTAAITRYYRA